ncbi:MAG: cell division protein FtsA [Treponema sp.]|nr:cell division protein FtsA [Treponema sp.]
MTDIIVGLDIGTSFVRAVIGEINEDNVIEIIGVAKKESSGLRNGVIVNIEATMDCIKSVIEEAEQIAGYEVTSCITGIGGVQIESMNSKGVVAVSAHGKRDREITQADVERVLEAANAVQIPMDRKMLHVIPQEYIVDGNPGYKDPINMIAVRLEAEVHIVTASKTAIQNITSCVNRAGYQLDRVMLKTLACAEAVMHTEEKDLGSIIIDLGGGTTDVLVILHDAPICTASIPVGGNLVTNDIAIVKGVPTAIAERIKVESGCCWLDLLDKDEEVIIPGIAGREPEQTTRSELCQIIQPRMEEIFTMVREEVMHRASVKQLAGNIILTGGGAQMPGAVELAETVFGTSSVRVGFPGNFGGIEEQYRTPEYATAVGLVTANKALVLGKNDKKTHRRSEGSGGDDDSDGFFQKLKKMFF